MKKRIVLIIATLSIAMLSVVGCSKKDNKKAVAETQATTSVATEAATEATSE